MDRPPLDEKTVDSFHKILDIFDGTTGDGIRKEVADALNSVIEAVKGAIGKVRSEASDHALSSRNEHSRLHGRVDEAHAKADSVRNDLRTIKLTPGPRGEKGDAIKGAPGNDGSPDTPEQVRDKLSSLQDDERLDASVIKGLDELEKKVEEKTGTTFRVGWGAHPLTVMGLGVIIDKNTRFINFIGAGVSSVTRSKDGVVTVSLSGGGGSSGTIVDQEVPTDSGDHTNFTIAHTPIAGTFKLYRGGAKQGSIGTTPDYTLVGTALVLTTALNTAQGEQLVCDYSY